MRPPPPPPLGPDPNRTAQQASAPELLPLRVERLQVDLHRRSTKTLLGQISVNTFAARFEDDDVRGRARLNQPG
jgi:hypothetical protein